eukprot:GHVR01136056.1.p1 GENE.GHVR01136056.1~~GHVR01136056.1.p1  ORF type:complete len:294 (+),score=19.64 GHVR01136056.1:19-900(+)
MTDGSIIVFSCPEFEKLAKEMTEKHSIFKRGEILWNHFEDGYPNMCLDQWTIKLRGKHVVFIASFLLENSKASLFDQIAIIYAIPRYSAASLTICLPYFPGAASSDQYNSAKIVTSKTLARILSATPKSILGGPAPLIMFDCHLQQERFYFSDAIIPVMATAIPLLMKALQTVELKGPLAIAFADEDAHKRFSGQLKGLCGGNGAPVEFIVCVKLWRGNQREVKIHEGTPKGHHVFILDDLVKSGATVLQCRRELIAQVRTFFYFANYFILRELLLWVLVWYTLSSQTTIGLK